MLTLQIIALADSETSPGNFVVILEESMSGRQLPIIIGAFEAQSIAMFIEQLKSPRPLTHDLFYQTIKALDCDLLSIHIGAVTEGSFVSCLILQTASGKKVLVDSRTSDALALSLRFSVPVTIEPEIFEQYALIEPAPQNSIRGSLWQYPVAELELLLAELLQKEDYESAAKVRDILNKKLARNS